jgi:hypothetical protein
MNIRLFFYLLLPPQALALFWISWYADCHSSCEELVT